MAELGKIEKPEAAKFSGKRKLVMVPLLFCGKDAPLEYIERYNRYWAQVTQQLTNLESGIGKTSFVFCESIVRGGEEGLKNLEQLNPECYSLVKGRVPSGASFEITEDRGLVDESIDWERCLLVGLISSKVARIVADNYLAALRKRYEYIAKRIDETLKPDTVGLLFIQEGHMIQFPADIEVFTVSPPALDELHRWQREEAGKTGALADKKEAN